MNGNDYVWCAQVRAVDPPQFIAETQAELGDREGELLGLEQCDNCGNVAFKLQREDSGSSVFVVVCTEDPDDEISHQFGGCGAQYHVRLLQARKVAF